MQNQQGSPVPPSVTRPHMGGTEDSIVPREQLGKQIQKIQRAQQQKGQLRLVTEPIKKRINDRAVARLMWPHDVWGPSAHDSAVSTFVKLNKEARKKKWEGKAKTPFEVEAGNEAKEARRAARRNGQAPPPPLQQPSQRKPRLTKKQKEKIYSTFDEARKEYANMDLDSIHREGYYSHNSGDGSRYIGKDMRKAYFDEKLAEAISSIPPEDRDNSDRSQHVRFSNVAWYMPVPHRKDVES